MPDHLPDPYRYQGWREVPVQDYGAEPDVADRIHLSKSHRLGLVLSPDDIPDSHRRLATLRLHEGR